MIWSVKGLSATPMVDMRQYIGERQVKLNSDLMTRQPQGRGPQHEPLAHLMFYRVIQHQIKDLRLRPRATVHSVSADGDRYFGMSMLESDDACFAPVVGWRAAHNQRVSTTLYSGAGFLESDALCLADAVTMKIRQTATFMDKLPKLVNSSLSSLIHDSRKQSRTYKLFKQKQISESEAEHAIIDMVRQGVINSRRIDHVIALWDYPIDPVLHKRRTVWRLFCAVADSYKPVTSSDAISTLVDRSPLLMNYCKDMIAADI